MRKMKRVLALLISMIMVLGMSAAVFAAVPAAATTASIEITKDASYEGGGEDPARVYQAYKIFDAVYESLDGENTQDGKNDFTYTPDDARVSYAMANDSKWLSVMQAAGQTWFDVKQAADASKWVVTPKENAYTTSEQALAFAEYLKDNMPSDVETPVDVTVNGGAVSVDPGYYLILAKDDVDSATKIALVTTDVKMVEKNTYITTSKSTAETSYNVGDTVEYTATVDIPEDAALTIAEGTGYKDGHGPVVLHDVMDSRLTFAGTIKSAKVDGADFAGYTLVWTEDASADNHTSDQTDGCTFELVIPVTEALLGKTITFTYEAEVNSTATSEEGFVNELGGSVNNYKTNKDDVYVYTFGFDLDKRFEGIEPSDGAADFVATFELRTTADDASTAIEFIEDSTGYVKADKDDTGASTVLTVTGANFINIRGLEAGTYYLVEKTTTTGFNLLDTPVKVVITDTTVNPSSPSRTITVCGELTTSVEILNQSGTVLPSTGGMGTTMFYILGSILVVGAGLVLVSRRRMSMI